jgi:hypothetical protein
MSRILAERASVRTLTPEEGSFGTSRAGIERWQGRGGRALGPLLPGHVMSRSVKRERGTVAVIRSRQGLSNGRVPMKTASKEARISWLVRGKGSELLHNVVYFAVLLLQHTLLEVNGLS